jgi:hypothetical protein
LYVVFPNTRRKYYKYKYFLIYNTKNHLLLLMLISIEFSLIHDRNNNENLTKSQNYHLLRLVSKNYLSVSKVYLRCVKYETKYISFKTKHNIKKICYTFWAKNRWCESINYTFDAYLHIVSPHIPARNNNENLTKSQNYHLLRLVLNHYLRVSKVYLVV